MTETQLSRSIQAALLRAGFWVIRVQSGMVKVRRGFMHLAPVGTPDLHIIGEGWIEVKVPGQELKPEQALWHEKARRLGVRVEVAESAKEAVETALRWRREREWERTMGWPEKAS